MAICVAALFFGLAEIPVNAAPRFTGTVDAAGAAYRTHNLFVSGPQRIDLRLDWSATGANLNLVLKNPAGTAVVRASSTTARPEIIRYPYSGTASGTWKITVVARSGKSAYTLDVGSPPPPPPPPVNKAPLARSDSVATPVNTPLEIPVLANDVDADGPSPMTIAGLTNPTAGGTVTPSTISADALNYAPPADFNGIDTFAYTACDSAPTPLCSTATTVSVLVGDPPPLASSDVSWTRIDESVSIRALANDTSFTGALHVESVTQPQIGTAEIASDGASVTYTAAAEFEGDDTFDYVACDTAEVQQCTAPTPVTVKVIRRDAWAGSIGVWAAENEASRHDWALDEAVGHARTFDALLTNPGIDPPHTYNDFVAEMKEASPSTLLVAYLNGTKSRIATDAENPWPDESYLYAADGSRVVQPFWGNYLMSPFDATWRSSRPIECNNRIALGFDTCYLDALALWALTNNSAKPISPNSGAVITSQEWLTATTAIAADVRSARPSTLPLWGSGGVNGPAHFGSSTRPPESQLLEGLDATVHEAFCRRPSAEITAFPTEAVWNLDVEMVREIESRGKHALPLTKIFVKATPEQKQAVMKYCLATFLLATDGASLFGFQPAKGDAMGYDPLWDTVLGPPDGAFATYAKTAGVYHRTFTNGLVLVNPTTSPVTVGLGASYRRPDGSVVKSQSLPPHTAEILTTLS